jgi:hypothetical protein
MGGRCATADATGEATSGVATINDREVGARFFWEDRQGKVERLVVITKPQGEESDEGSRRQVWSTRYWSHDMHDSTSAPLLSYSSTTVYSLGSTTSTLPTKSLNRQRLTEMSVDDKHRIREHIHIN